MSEFEKQLLEKVNELTRRVDGLESEKLKREVEAAGPDFICDAEAIAHLWGCSVTSVRNGSCGTGAIKRLPGRFIRATKREVMAALSRRNRSASDIAVEVFTTAKSKRKSLIRR
jgi:sugar-specific transcriptional regulator TrmB